MLYRTVVFVEKTIQPRAMHIKCQVFECRPSEVIPVVLCVASNNIYNNRQLDNPPTTGPRTTRPQCETTLPASRDNSVPMASRLIIFIGEIERRIHIVCEEYYNGGY